MLAVSYNGPGIVGYESISRLRPTVQTEILHLLYLASFRLQRETPSHGSRWLKTCHLSTQKWEEDESGTVSVRHPLSFLQP